MIMIVHDTIIAVICLGIILAIFYQAGKMED